MGVFPEDTEIRVSLLIKLWVAEGFLKPISGKSLEVVAEDYFNDLIDRNLILVHTRTTSGKIKFCKIHDLLRDLCLREAEKEKFLFFLRKNSPDSLQCLNTERRIVVHSGTSYNENSHQLSYGFQSTSVARSFISDSVGYMPPFTCRLLRVLQADSAKLYLGSSREDEYFIKDVFQLVNLWHLAFQVESNLNLVYLLWNLQTLIIKSTPWQTVALSEIWLMPHLRHVFVDKFHHPDPPCVEYMPVFVLRNLQTLLMITNFKCSEDVVKRIPNIKKLQLCYKGSEEDLERYCLNNLGHLHKLESLTCEFYFSKKRIRNYLVQNITFPQSLKKLTLEGSRLHWDEMSSKVGSLPLLQVLKLKEHSCIGPKWVPDEGQFCSLKFLLIEWCEDLEYWMADNANFPRLEKLVLRFLDNLKEVPSGIGDIPTLRPIQLTHCSHYAVFSAKKIVDGQEELGNEDLKVQVLAQAKDEIVKRLESRNFQVQTASW
ncbi:hypothetical protein BUALT_Bualt07G0160800 [Buddleja alternifolia]|uniref:Disease resistance protein winged helix domain-containing protein n=1 Tax=Buddleja alternifolia TaxID=168488 RepID=A0AAV6XI77_9LAMI|nr:hypothetical protein BUALT_Bualt07G0160800 [Buddleja alternifolia]